MSFLIFVLCFFNNQKCYIYREWCKKFTLFSCLLFLVLDYFTRAHLLNCIQIAHFLVFNLNSIVWGINKYIYYYENTEYTSLYRNVYLVARILFIIQCLVAVFFSFIGVESKIECVVRTIKTGLNESSYITHSEYDSWNFTCVVQLYIQYVICFWYNNFDCSLWLNSRSFLNSIDGFSLSVSVSFVYVFFFFFLFYLYGHKIYFQISINLLFLLLLLSFIFITKHINPFCFCFECIVDGLLLAQYSLL